VRAVRGRPLLRRSLRRRDRLRIGGDLLERDGHDGHLRQRVRAHERSLHARDGASCARRRIARPLRGAEWTRGGVLVRGVREVLERLPAERMLRRILVQRAGTGLHAPAEQLSLKRAPGRPVQATLQRRARLAVQALNASTTKSRKAVTRGGTFLADG
jgi:hypothetical protein